MNTIQKLKLQGINTSLMEKVEGVKNNGKVYKRDIIIQYYSCIAKIHGVHWKQAHQFGVWAYLAHKLNKASYANLRAYGSKLNPNQHYNFRIRGYTIPDDVWQTLCAYPYQDFGKDMFRLVAFKNIPINDRILKSLKQVLSLPEQQRVERLAILYPKETHLVLDHKYITFKDSSNSVVMRPFVTLFDKKIFVWGFGLFKNLKRFKKEYHKQWKVRKLEVKIVRRK